MDEPILTPIKDLGFSHDTEADDGDWDGLEKVYAKFTAQWYVDSNGLAWNVESPGYVLREREVFLDGVCSVIKERDGDEWLIRLYGPGYNVEGDWPPGDYFLYVNKHVTDGKPWYDISWNANFEGEAASSSAQWILGEDFQFDGEEDLSSFTLSNDLVKLEVKPIPSFSKTPYVHPRIKRLEREEKERAEREERERAKRIKAEKADRIAREYKEAREKALREKREAREKADRIAREFFQKRGRKPTESLESIRKRGRKR